LLRIDWTERHKQRRCVDDRCLERHRRGEVDHHVGLAHQRGYPSQVLARHRPSECGVVPLWYVEDHLWFVPILEVSPDSVVRMQPQYDLERMVDLTIPNRLDQH